MSTPETTPSRPAGASHPRRRGRWVAGAGLAAFAGVLIFLSVQLWRGRDPVVGGGDGRPGGAPATRAADAPQRVTTRTSGDAPVAADAGPIESLVGSLLGGGSGDHGDHDDDGD